MEIWENKALIKGDGSPFPESSAAGTRWPFPMLDTENSFHKFKRNKGTQKQMIDNDYKIWSLLLLEYVQRLTYTSLKMTCYHSMVNMSE